MKKLSGLLCLLAAMLFTGCASYQATSLAPVDPNFVKEYPQAEGVSIGCKAYSKQDCYDYLDRDVIAKGYQPILLTFQNRGDQTYIFSTSNVSLPCISAETVARTVKTNTAGRVVGYSVGGLFVWPLFIPAIVDGIKSSNANTALEQDFDAKVKQHLVLNPGAFAKTLIFVPKAQFQPIFDISLLNEDTGAYKTIGLSAIR